MELLNILAIMSAMHLTILYMDIDNINLYDF